jgi:hypothetical protein
MLTKHSQLTNRKLRDIADAALLARCPVAVVGGGRPTSSPTK